MSITTYITGTTCIGIVFILNLLVNYSEIYKNMYVFLWYVILYLHDYSTILHVYMSTGSLTFFFVCFNKSFMLSLNYQSLI